MTKNPTFHTRVAMTLFLLILTILAPTSKAWADYVKYINKDGVEKNDLNATKLNGSNSGITLYTNTYYVEGTVTCKGTITLDGNTTIILCDGATLNIGTSGEPVSGYCINGGNYSLTIYGQTKQTGTIKAYCSGDHSSNINLSGSYTQHGGNVNLNGTGASKGITLDGNNQKLTLTRGNLTVHTADFAIELSGSDVSIDISGGTLTATATGDNGLAIRGNVNMSGGVLTANGQNSGIGGDVTMSGGVLTAIGDVYGIYWSDVNFTGGNLTATGGTIGIVGTATLDYTSGYDSFTANKCTVSIADGKQFLDGGTPVSGNNIVIDDTTTLTPDNRGDIASSTRIDLEVHDDGTGNYWTTFYHPAVGFNISANENDVPTAYIATVSGSKVELTGIEPRGCVPAGQAVIVKTATYGNGKITLTRSDDINQPSGTNHLKGGASVTPGLDAYTLSRGDGGTGTLGFYKFSGTSLDPYKAHLEIDPSSFSPARGFIGIDDDGTTGILTPPLAPPLIGAGSSEAAWYSLDGRRLSGKPVKKGVYVRNGQKYIIK